MQLREAITWAEEYLDNRGVPDGKRCAEYLLADLYQHQRYELYLNSHHNLNKSDEKRFRQLVCKRGHGVPLGYLAGYVEFMGYRFRVNSSVFIPRPETEILLSCACEKVNLLKKREEPLVVDIGTGSGNIAVSLALRCSVEVIACDISMQALAVAKENAILLGTAEKVIFWVGDLWEPLTGVYPNKISLIVCNPPYVARENLSFLPREVTDYEPRIAWDGGNDGLVFYRRIIPVAPEFLQVGGYLLLELGYEQSQSVVELVRKNQGLEVVEVVKDYAGIDRVLIVQKK